MTVKTHYEYAVDWANNVPPRHRLAGPIASFAALVERAEGLARVAPYRTWRRPVGTEEWEEFDYMGEAAPENDHYELDAALDAALDSGRL